MDTDDLSKEIYYAVLVEAEKFNHDLTLQFGLLSYKCSNESEFIENAIGLIAKLKKIKLENLDSVFFDKIPDIKELQKALDKILNNINEVKQIPFEKKTFRF